MAVPKFDELMKPLLAAINDGEVYKITDIIIVVSKSAPSILCYTPTLKTTLKKLFSGI